MVLSSRSNTKIKHLRRLQQRKYRRESHSFLLEGSGLLWEAHLAGYEILQLFRAPEAIFPELQAVALEDYELDSELLAYVSSLKSPPDLIGVLRMKNPAEDDQRLPAWLLCEQLQDPGNFGALLRLADAMNWRGILALGDYPDPLQAKVLRASMGSALRLPVREVSLQELTQWQEQGWTLVGTAADASHNSFNQDLPQSLILALGHEGQGLSTELQDLCQLGLSIPIRTGVDSLNVVTAAAMLVHEANRQWAGAGALS